MFLYHRTCDAAVHSQERYSEVSKLAVALKNVISADNERTSQCWSADVTQHKKFAHVKLPRIEVHETRECVNDPRKCARAALFQ